MQSNSTSYRVSGTRGIFTLRHADGQGGYTIEDARKIIAAYLLARLMDNRPGTLNEIREKYADTQSMDDVVCVIADNIKIREVKTLSFRNRIMQRVHSLFFHNTERGLTL